MAKINVRSPYFVNVDIATITSAKIEVLIYEGFANASWQGSPQYTLTSTAIDAKVNFEIAELIKDYIPAQFNGGYTLGSTGDIKRATTINVDYRVTPYIGATAQTVIDTLGVVAFYGYGFFEDGVNPQLLQGLLQY